MNPMDRPTAFFEIAILLLISFVIGFIAARIPLADSDLPKGGGFFKKGSKKMEEEQVDPRDIITEPTTIQAVLTRDRKGNAIGAAPVKTKLTNQHQPTTPPAKNLKIAAIKKDFSTKSKNPQPFQTKNRPKKD